MRTKRFIHFLLILIPLVIAFKSGHSLYNEEGRYYNNMLILLGSAGAFIVILLPFLSYDKVLSREEDIEYINYEEVE